MITIDLAISFSIGGVVGFIVREIVGDRLARSRTLEAIRITEFNRAAAKLREAFLPVRMVLNPAQFALKEDLAIFLNNHFNNLREAVLGFSDILDTNSKTAFLQAWYEYYCHEDQRNERGVPFLEQYFCQGLTTQQEHQMKKLVQDRIDKILEFAKPK
jgi:hypothetical protein